MLSTNDSFNRNIQVISENLIHYEQEIRSLTQSIDFLTNAWDALASYQSSFVLIKRLKYDQANPELFMYNHNTLKAFSAAQNSLETQIHLKGESTVRAVELLREVVGHNREVLRRNVDLLSQKKTIMKFDS